MFRRAVVWVAMGCAVAWAQGAPENPRFTYDHGGIVRGDRAKKQIALVFTGGDFGDGTAAILDTLKSQRIAASLFVTGDFLRQPEQAKLLRRALREGQYVGPHSDRHLLYAPWETRDKSIISEEEFKRDLKQNIGDLRALGALPVGQPALFIPPFEWFNRDQVRWAREMGVRLFNFTPGSGSNRDYLPESDKRFVPSQRILEDILAYEKKDPDGLNGFILLLHLGADRTDKMYRLLPRLIEELRGRGYGFVRVDEMLEASSGAVSR